MSKTKLKRPRIEVGDLVENILVPDLDYRVVNHVSLDTRWLSLDFGSGALCAPLPTKNYRVIRKGK